MPLALALVSRDAVFESLERQIVTTDARMSWAFLAEDFWDMLPKRPYEIVIADASALRGAPASFVERVRRVHPDACLVLLSDEPPVHSRGPHDERIQYLRLPLAEGAIARALARPEPPADRSADPLDLVAGSGESMEALRGRIRRFAAVDSNVLVLGESGVGKEVIARAIHALSPRRDGPFVAVHCGAIPTEIVESELFGHVRGAFTGADRDRPGRFELAHGGTLFLDEIGTMRPEHQVRLLRVLQDRFVTPVGSDSQVPVDARVVAATNADLRGLIEAGRFREDLFFRLNVLAITVPPLRERIEDIPELARRFAERFARRNGLRPKPLTSRALERLVSHPWRGNVRELENAVEHAMVVAQGPEIDLLDLPWEIGERRSGVDRSLVRLTADGLDLNATVSRLEREMILQSLALAGGNKSRAAELLRLKRTTFVEKMKRFDLLEEEEPATLSV